MEFNYTQKKVNVYRHVNMLFICRVYLITCMKFSPIGQRGRPKKSVTREQIQCVHNLGYTVPKMAEHFKCSRHLVYKRLYEELHQRGRYTTAHPIKWRIGKGRESPTSEVSEGRFSGGIISADCVMIITLMYFLSISYANIHNSEIYIIRPNKLHILID